MHCGCSSHVQVRVLSPFQRSTRPMYGMATDVAARCYMTSYVNLVLSSIVAGAHMFVPHLCPHTHADARTNTHAHPANGCMDACACRHYEYRFDPTGNAKVAVNAQHYAILVTDVTQWPYPEMQR